MCENDTRWLLTVHFARTARRGVFGDARPEGRSAHHLPFKRNRTDPTATALAISPLEAVALAAAYIPAARAAGGLTGEQRQRLAIRVILLRAQGIKESPRIGDEPVRVAALDRLA
jgi:hypothetical protein